MPALQRSKSAPRERAAGTAKAEDAGLKARRYIRKMPGCASAETLAAQKLCGLRKDGELEGG
jgi:hypothetical protein